MDDEAEEISEKVVIMITEDELSFIIGAMSELTNASLEEQCLLVNLMKTYNLQVKDIFNLPEDL